ncbi:hypothetical protein FACS189450_06390 [Spirochaetia bacterium]|nr:hypothetical protein FACS189450_06390 [Spirochaetia bacterium]
MRKKALVFLTAVVAVSTVFLMGCPTDPPPTEYTVTFNANGGTVATESVKVETGKTVSSLPTPTKVSGDTIFWGWFSKDGTGGDWGSAFTSSTVVTGDITVYARWGNTAAPTLFTVTLNADGGTVTPTSIQVLSGDTVGTLPTPTKSGNTFGGWYTAQNGGGTAFTAASAVSASITVYAKWTATGGGSYDGTYIMVAGNGKIVLSGSNFTSSQEGEGGNWDELGKGTFTVLGTTITFTLTHENDGTGEMVPVPEPTNFSGTISSDGQTITIAGGSTYTKQ